MVKLLDRYVFLEGLKFLILSLITFLTIFAVIDFVSNISVASKLGIEKELLLIAGKLPLYTVRVLPIAVLISVMLTLSNFSSTSELIAVRALGISTLRFSIPLIGLAVLSSLFSLATQQFLIPKGLKTSLKIEKVLKPHRKTEAKGIWFKSKKGNFVFIKELNLKEREGEWGSLIEVKDFQPIERIDGEKVIYLGGGIWEFKNVLKRNLTEIKTETLPELKLNLGVKLEELKLPSLLPQEKSLTELFVIVKQLERLGYDATQFRMELLSRLAISLYPIVVAIIGIPLGVYNPRNRRKYTVVLAGAIIVLMWITTSFFISLGKSGVLPPMYAAFAPLALFTAVGLIMIGRIES